MDMRVGDAGADVGEGVSVSSMVVVVSSSWISCVAVSNGITLLQAVTTLKMINKLGMSFFMMSP
jgi:hypothetical protein